MRGNPLKVQQKLWENGTQVVVKGREADGMRGSAVGETAMAGVTKGTGEGEGEDRS